MGMISINNILFIAKVGSLGTAASSLEIKAAALPARSSVSAVMDRYSDLYKALNEAIVSYESLLARDQKKISSVGTAMMSTDAALSKMFH